MAFRKPITTLGGTTWWNNIKQNELFIMQEHKVGIPVWPYKFRILLRENRMEIANSNDIEDIEYDWKYLESHTIPQIEDKIDFGKMLSDIDLNEILKLINKIPTIK